MPKRAPKDRKYTGEHEWILDEGNGIALIGITDYAQEMLTDIVFVELPPPGKGVRAGQSLAVVESVKSVSEVYAPVGGVVTEVNGLLEEKPELVNQDAYGAGWMVRLRMDDPAELSGLMDALAYDELVAQADH
ncbi:MAG: glycine cleavage system protein GcvH [Deltaproteobacteria bacterium]|nr:glycine cleavage system protein GcvH [Deltaproteobacteria bacterium]